MIATRNRAARVLEAARRAAALPERPQVIVVDNGSEDGTTGLLRRQAPAVRLLALPVNRGAAARNIGARLARTPLVAFCDDDSWFVPGALGRAQALFAVRRRLGLVAASVWVQPGGTLDPTCARMADSPLPTVAAAGASYRQALGFLACGAVARRTAILEVGGFPPAYVIGGEEEPVTFDLWTNGWEVLYAPDVVAHHEPSAVRDEARRRQLLVRNALWTAWTRRRPRAALACTAEALGRERPSVATVRGATDALRGWRWVVRHRSPVPAELESRLAGVAQARRAGARMARAPASMAVP